MFEIDDIFDDIAKEFKSRFDLIISICDSRSHIEKLFLAKLYRFFYLRQFPVNLLTYDAQTLELEKSYKAESYNPNHDYYKTDKSKGYFTHPLYGLSERVSGLLIEGITINYKIYPQKPIHNHERLVYADFAIIITDKLNKVLGKFIIECDGFDWHNTVKQLNRDNVRNRFLTRYGYKIIRYTGNEINQLNDRDIIKLENIIYHSIFNEESDIYKWETY
jgi:very-short-patch-repair endonuclease